MIGRAICLACAASLVASSAAAGEPVETFTFNGDPAPKWDAVEEGSVSDDEGVLRLAEDFAVGAALIDTNKLPDYNPVQKELVRAFATVTGVVLVPNTYLLHSVTLRAACGDVAAPVTTVATLRAYRPERGSAQPTVEAILERDGGGEAKEELTGADITGAVQMKLTIEDGATHLEITDASSGVHTVDLTSGAKEKFVGFRVELAGNGQKAVRPSVGELVLELEVKEIP